ncbi:MAG: radical SAM protein [bacterium]
MMKILLVNPPNCGRSISQEKYGFKPAYQIFRGEPLALEALAGNLYDHKTHILDLKVQGESLSDTLSAFDPDLVGITGLTCEVRTVLRLCQNVKEQKKESTVVVGGIHASSDPQFFNHPAVDYIVTGLGKASFRELVSAIETGRPTERIPGIARTNPAGRLSYIPRNYSREDLVESCAPRFDLVDKYRDHYRIPALGLQMGFVATAFGCIHSCSFCSIANLTGKRYLTCHTDTVIRDIRLLGDIPFIRLVDANSFGDVKRAKQLCQAIAEADLKKLFLVDACADTVVDHQELFEEWKKSGLQAVVVGFEEINNTLLAQWGKKNTAGIVREAIRILHDLDISIVGDFIISPDYEERDFQVLTRFVEENRIQLPVFSVLTPLPGTPLYRSMKDKIVIHDLDYYTLTNAVTRTKLPEEEFYTLFIELATRFHSRKTL